MSEASSPWYHRLSAMAAEHKSGEVESAEEDRYRWRRGSRLHISSTPGTSCRVTGVTVALETLDAASHQNSRPDIRETG